MDTSETYVKMCEKATEIQVLKVGLQWCPLHNRAFRWNSEEEEYVCSDYPNAPWNDNDSHEPYETPVVFLPGQDQLQEMVLDDETDTLCLALNFSEWLKQRLWGNIECTFEQLWLAYVMWTKYKKKWNSEDWLTTSR